MVMRIDYRQSWFENRFFVLREPSQARRRVPRRGLLLLCGLLRGLLCVCPPRPCGRRRAKEQGKLASIHGPPPLLRETGPFNLPQAESGGMNEGERRVNFSANRTEGRADLLDAHATRRRRERGKGAVAIVKEVARRLVPGNGLTELLRSPEGG